MIFHHTYGTVTSLGFRTTSSPCVWSLKKGKPCLEVTPAEKGETTIVLTVFNATRSYSATMIYKGTRLRDEWCLGCPENVVAKVSENGWINSVCQTSP